MRRALVSILLALSFVALVLSVALWIRSYFREEFAVGQSSDSLVELGSDHGTAVVELYCYRSDVRDRRRWSLVSEPAGSSPEAQPDVVWKRRWGFGIATTIDMARGRLLMVPYWAITLYFLAATALLFPIPGRLCRSRRRKSGCCENCGYDQRGTPNRCPECGLMPSARPPLVRGSSLVGPIFAAASILSIGWLIWWSNPRRGAPPGLGANPGAGICFYPSWEGARGEDADRMLRRDDGWGITWYQSIWRTPDGDRLVILCGPGGHMFYDFWRVIVLDRSMKVVREGSVGLETDRAPCRLFEIRSDDSAMPAAHRNQWLLCVQWQDRPVSTSSSDGDDADAKSNQSPADSLNPVQWDNDPKSENPAEWKQIHPLQVRSAEEAGIDSILGKPAIP